LDVRRRTPLYERYAEDFGLSGLSLKSQLKCGHSSSLDKHGFDKLSLRLNNGISIYRSGRCLPRTAHPWLGMGLAHFSLFHFYFCFFLFSSSFFCLNLENFKLQNSSNLKKFELGKYLILKIVQMKNVQI
jgi:hypothetical protein